MVISSPDALGKKCRQKKSSHIEESYCVINLMLKRVVLLKNSPSDSKKPFRKILT